MASTNRDASLEATLVAGNPTAGTLQVAKAIYRFAKDGGAQGLIQPLITASLPKNAVIVGSTINSTTTCTASGSGTMAIGTSAGSSASSILTATAVASLGSNSKVNGAATFAAPVKLSATGNVTVTIATADFTAGVVEITLLYFVANA